MNFFLYGRFWSRRYRKGRIVKKIVIIILLQDTIYCRQHAKKRHLNDWGLWTVIFTVSVAKMTVHTVKCTGAHRNFSNATNNYLNLTSNYLNAVFCVKPFDILWHSSVNKFGNNWPPHHKKCEDFFFKQR